jgi:spore coat protein CotH
MGCEQERPWRIKFDTKTEFLGSDYAKAKSWTLLANTFDKSLMRNALTYYLGKFVGLPFCPSARFVDLVMNGTYRGTYQISDQMEVNKKRVNINSDTGWMFEYANASDKVDDPKITTTYGWVQIKNPDDKVLTSATTTDMTNYLNSLDDSISTSTTGYTYIDPNTGYRRMVDATTLINWYIATEITANWDGFYSVYSYRDPNGPLCLGPMWDEDLAYGNHTETYDTSYFPNGFYNKLLADNNFSNTTWGGYRKLQPVIAHLYDDPWFANAVYMRFNELVNNGIEKNLLDNIESMRTLLKQSAATEL